jgi:hypothetical protein
MVTVDLRGAEDLQRSWTGVFVSNDTLPTEQSGGRPVYMKDSVHYLFYLTEVGNWLLGSDYSKNGGYAYSSSDAGCPSEAMAWQLWTGDTWSSPTEDNVVIIEVDKLSEAAKDTLASRFLSGKAVATGVALILAVILAVLILRREPKEDDGDAVVLDTMTYKIKGLTTWEVFTAYPCTVWDNEMLWQMMRKLLGVSVLVAVLEFLLTPDPNGMDPTLFDKVGTMLNVFVGLLLSFFLTSNVARWVQIVNGFRTLFNSTRNLQLVLHAFGAKKEASDRVLRYCVLSARLVTYDMQRRMLPQAERPAALATMWEDLEARDQPFSKLMPEERAQLETAEDPSGLIWTWVMSMLGRMVEDGELPTWGAGSLGMVLMTATTAKKGMDGLRDTIVVQLPFVYVHTVATIVQLNNLLAAVSLGLTLGTTFGVAVARWNSYLHVYSIELSRVHRPVMEDIQEVLVQLFRCFVAPVLYQAFFEIGVSIASPFYSEDGEIPVERMLGDLEQALQDSNVVASKPPLWEAPCMKK